MSRPILRIQGHYPSNQSNSQINCLRIVFGCGSVADYQINSPEMLLGKVGNPVNMLSVMHAAVSAPTSLVGVVQGRAFRTL